MPIDVASLEQANFGNAYLEGIDLSGANLCGSSFVGACLIRANLTGADLSPTSKGSTPTSLAGTCLQGAQFTTAKLDAVDLTRALIAFEEGSFNVRYCDGDSGPYPAPPDHVPINYRSTTGLDETTLMPDTICPNGLTLRANQFDDTDLQTMLTINYPRTEWICVDCFRG